ncbi:TPA: host cell division inhibitor Icd-like protein [Morganella morganii]|nr:host cell division inhibitor Icd-like protein [Morganella morganii]HCT3284277.1 host cell division inhibitor Icd-like protein [Morganella morganii]HCU0876673.1 host cell division inhibitor Icd-like protein [Morganella morganii]
MPNIHCMSNGSVPKPDTYTAVNQMFTFRFFVIKRIDQNAKPECKEVQAPDLRSAKLQLVRDYILSLATQIPVKAV